MVSKVPIDLRVTIYFAKCISELVGSTSRINNGQFRRTSFALLASLTYSRQNVCSSGSAYLTSSLVLTTNAFFTLKLY